jgi:hypothetical protein
VSQIAGRNCERCVGPAAIAGSSCRIKTSLLSGFPRGLIAPSGSLAGIWIQYQSMRMMTGVEVEHIYQPGYPSPELFGGEVCRSPWR